MRVPRREFLSGAAAFAFGGWRLCAAPLGWRSGAKPRLVFGVLSDTHLLSHPFRKLPSANWSLKYFTAALEYFKSQHVDAVVHCGDLAHRGRVHEMEFHAEVWRDVFGKRGPEKLFVAGNHDFRGDCKGRKLVDEGMAVNWERIWGEPYEEVWHKEVKGCHFFGRHWGVDDERLVDIVKSKCSGRERKPIFILSHSISGLETRKALGEYRNALGFFGHWHHSAATWSEIYCADGLVPFIQVPPCHPQGEGRLAHGGDVLNMPIEKSEHIGRGRQGYLVRVYDDMLAIERREFGEGGSLGADWVMPFEREEGKGKREEERIKKPHPFSKGELKKVIGEPQFRKGAKLEVSLDRIDKINKIAKTANDNPVNPVNLVQENPASPKLCVRIPLADGNPGSRVYAYEVVVIGEAGSRKLFKAVYATGCNMGIGHEPNGGVTTLEIPKSELPSGKTLTIAARPLTSLGTSGRPIATEFKASGGRTA